MFTYDRCVTIGKGSGEEAGGWVGGSTRAAYAPNELRKNDYFSGLWPFLFKRVANDRRLGYIKIKQCYTPSGERQI